MVNLFEYQNYREYLRAYYEEMKRSKKSFSYRSFSTAAGINAPSFLFYVIEGKRNLTKNTIMKIASAIGFSSTQCDYFENLVFFNQAKTITEKASYYNKLIEIRKPIDISTVHSDRYDYYSAWYHCVIREIITFFDFQDDYHKLARFLVPSITALQARNSILLLERLGFIERDKDGLYHQTESLIFAKAGQTDAFIIQKFQIEMLSIAMKAYDTVSPQHRISTSTTFSNSKETFELFKTQIRDLQQRLMEIARIDESPSEVYQLSLNLFRVSESTDGSTD